MSVAKETVERIASSERAVHLAWLLVLLLLEMTSTVVAEGGSSGP